MQDLSGKPEAPRVPRPESEYLKAGGDIRPEVSRPLYTEETAGFAVGDPFSEHGLPDVRHENASGKKMCGMCLRKKKDEWECGYFFSCPSLAVECHRFLPKPSTPRPPQPKKRPPGIPGAPPGVSLLYFGRTKVGNLARQGVVTVAWIESSPGTLVMGFSFCSPSDPWCKATGRDMAIKRLYEHPVVIPFLYDVKRTVHEVTRAMLFHDFERLAGIAPGVTMWGRVPSWTMGLGKRLETRRRTLPFLDFGGGVYIAPQTRALPFNIMARMMRDIGALGND